MTAQTPPDLSPLVATWRGEGSRPRRKRAGLSSLLAALGAAVAVSLGAPPSVATARGDAPDTLYLGNYPSGIGRDWTENIQGLAHDDGHWFITNESILLKFPVDFDLKNAGNVSELPASVRRVRITAIPELHNYDHFGDLDQAGGLLFVPLEDNKDNDDGPRRKDAIGIFRASDLSFVGLKETFQGSLGWVAYNRHERMLYSSDGTVSNASPLYRYRVDLEALKSGGDAGAGILFHDRFTLYEADGSALTPGFGDYMQGGVFTPWGDLYLINGQMYGSPGDVRGGIHVFDPNGRMIAESQNGSGRFNFEYNPGTPTFDEPEGIDWWNRSGADPASPGISGQLHVLLLDQDILPTNEDDLYFKHYDVAYLHLQDADQDGDGLGDWLEGYNLDTDPRDADTDDDGLSDGVEVNQLGTDPLSADSDGDGVPDGAEDSDGDGLSDGVEVGVHGTDPMDADTDGDGLTDGLEVEMGTNPLDADSDDDGLMDGRDVEFLRNAVIALPASAFRSPASGTRTALLSVLDDIEALLLPGDTAGAVRKLRNLRGRMDGYGTAADSNDWIVDRDSQMKIRSLLDLLVANLGG